MTRRHLLMTALCCCLAAVSCGARSGLPSSGDDARIDAADDGGPAVDQLPDAPRGCVHPQVTRQCSGGWCTIPAGCFKMGSPKGEPCREPQDNAAYGRETLHEVVLTRGFVIQQTEATQTDFYALVYHKQSNWCIGCAMSGISWGAAAAYCNALSQQQGLTPCYSCSGSGYDHSCATAAAYRQGNKIYSCPGYRLPTEAEWEYAYRAGTTSAFYSGPMPADASCDDCKKVPALDAIAWYCADKGAYGNGNKGAAKQPNAWGLHDMAGNVWEWCQDAFVANLGDKRRVDPVSTTGDGYHVHRGGASWYLAKFARAAARGKSNSSADLGVRCVRSLKP